MVVEELGEEAGRKRPELIRVGRPDRGDLGHDQPLDEVVGVPARRRRTRAARARCRWSRSARAPRGRSGAGRAASGGTTGRRGGRGSRTGPRGVAAHSNAAAAVGDREAHGRSAAWRRPSSASRRSEVRVVAVVEDDEAGVDRELARPASRPRSCSCGPPGERAGLEHGDLVARAIQLAGGDEAGDAAADDRRPHSPRTGQGWQARARDRPSRSRPGA